MWEPIVTYVPRRGKIAVTACPDCTHSVWSHSASVRCNLSDVRGKNQNGFFNYFCTKHTFTCNVLSLKQTCNPCTMLRNGGEWLFLGCLCGITWCLVWIWSVSPYRSCIYNFKLLASANGHLNGFCSLAGQRQCTENDIYNKKNKFSGLIC